MSARQLKRAFFWLSGAGTESLESCPNWEQRKYVAFGATVLVPTVFAFIACSYALSTLTDNWRIIIPVSLAWSFIILTIDRALLATYRSFQSFRRKTGQFFLRFVVALLMGLTISHPLTLLLFKDTIQSVVEQEREIEIGEVRELAETAKAAVEGKVTALEAEIATQREKWNQTFDAEFLVEGDTSVDRPTTDEEAAAQAELQAKIDEATAPYRERIAVLDEEMQTTDADYRKIASELDFWQTEFEREVNGQRSGIIGLGPRAKSIQNDQLEWRRAESKRLASVLDHLTAERAQLRAMVQAAEGDVAAEFADLEAEEAARLREERDRIAALKEQVQQEQADQFVEQQNAIRATIAKQIDARLEELERLQQERAKLAEDAQTRIDAIRAEPRRDILTQTLALHRLFREGSEGGQFALAAYLVLTLLFMLVDTIPLIVKFFSKPGPYDTLLDCEETRYDREREAFLTSYQRYMNELSGTRLLHLTQNKPLERALIEGVDRSRAAKEFLESLLEMERAFEDRIRVERESLAAEGSGKAAARARMLEEMAETFYDDLRARMAAFFATDGKGNPAPPNVIP